MRNALHDDQSDDDCTRQEDPLTYVKHIKELLEASAIPWNVHRMEVFSPIPSRSRRYVILEAEEGIWGQFYHIHKNVSSYYPA